MPILQYKCEKCGKKFEELVAKYDDEVRCPACGETLCLNGRIPMRLPETCPHCGHPLTPPRRGGRSAPAAKAEEPIPAAEQPRLDEAAEEEAAEEPETARSGEEQNP